MSLGKKELQGKRVLVFGSGISGIGAAKLLEAAEAQVVLYDGNEKLEIRSSQRGSFQKLPPVKLFWES